MARVPRVGLFVLSLYSDARLHRDRGELDRMVLWPQGEVSILQALAVVDHLARCQREIVKALIDGAQQGEEGAALNEYLLAFAEPEGREPAAFDKPA